MAISLELEPYTPGGTFQTAIVLDTGATLHAVPDDTYMRGIVFDSISAKAFGGHTVKMDHQANWGH